METLGKYTVHPLAALFPEAIPEEDAALEARLSTHGVLDHGGLGVVILYRGQILDGRSLLAAYKRLGVEPRFETLPDDADALAFLLAKNVHRRILSESQRAVVAYRLWSQFGSGAPDTGDGDWVNLRTLTQQQCADLLRVSRSLMTHAARVFSPDSPSVPELRRAVELGQVRVTDASGVLARPSEVQRRAAAMVAGREAKTITTAVKKVNRETALREEAASLAASGAMSLGNAPTIHQASVGDMQVLVDPATIDAIITHPLPGRGTDKGM